MPRGGKRYGTPGKAYSNRSDLQGSRPVPIQAAKGQQYGKAGAQRAAQRAIPIAPPPAPATGGPAAPATAPAGPPAPSMAAPAPGQVVPLDAPTMRPDEPITAGMDRGPGPGSEVLGPLATRPDDDGVGDLAMYLPMLEFMASQPGASAQTRNFVRRLRGSAPVT